MATLEDFLKINNIPGVDQYILVDQDSQVVNHKTGEPEKLAKIVFLCTKNSSAVAKTHLKYIVFSRKNKKNLYVFPIGNYCLGVVKHKTISDEVFTRNIILFLNSLLKKEKVKY